MDDSALNAAERKFLAALNARGVRFMVVGMSAALLQGARGATEDIDLWFEDLGDPGIAEAAREAGGFLVSGTFGMRPPALGGAARRLIHFELGTSLQDIESVTPLAGFDWSPDGSRIATTRGFGGEGLTLTTVATGDTVHLPAPFAASSPVWSPDGRSIAIVGGNPIFTFGTGYFANSGASGIWIVHLDGSGPTRIAADQVLNISPQWSADGRALFWVSDRDGSRDIYRQLIRRDGTPEGPVQRLTTGTDAQGLSLARDGGRMAYTPLHTYSSIWSIPVPARGPVSIRGATAVTSGNENRPLIDGETTTGFSIFSRSSRTRSQVRGVPRLGDDWP